MVPPGNILFLLLLPEWRLLLRTSPFPAPCFENHLSPLIYLPSPSTVAAAQMTPGSCSGCGPLFLPLLAGLVAADAVVSQLIVVVVFVCVRPRSRPTQEDGKIYINMPGRG
ncbi:hematopoietic cell signal transducer [Balaenoptera ricei]|uniref:hematopoietic cell signal transducer n=1 Tax=Balaenoptera ricei TaxID=2746895 RepID=UPI0028BD1C77|nr:hematopoietic cell signal transducer [Balaenoptera ricei]